MANDANSAQMRVGSTLTEAPSTRSLLLDSAAELMRERDTTSVSLSDIAERANANSALVKYYFSNKQGLMLALLDRALVDELVSLNTLVLSDRTASEKMRLHLTAMILAYSAHPYLNRLLSMVLRDESDARANDISERLVDPVVDAHRKILSQGQDEGVFRKVDSMIFYLNAVGVCDALATSRSFMRYSFDKHEVDAPLLRDYIEQTTDMVMGQLLK